MFYKGGFFIEEPQTKFMRAIAGLLMTKAEKKYTLVKKKNERGKFSSKIRGQGWCGLPRVSQRPGQRKHNLGKIFNGGKFFIEEQQTRFRRATVGLSTSPAEKIYHRKKNDKGFFFIEEPHIRFMRLLQVSRRPRQRKNTLSKNFNEENFCVEEPWTRLMRVTAVLLTIKAENIPSIRNLNVGKLIICISSLKKSSSSKSFPDDVFPVPRTSREPRLLDYHFSLVWKFYRRYKLSRCPP